MVRPIRLKVDEVYRKLQRLCDVLEGKPDVSHDPNPHELLLRESDEILDGLKALFKKSTHEEQVRLMTIAPKKWGRQKREKWYVVKNVSYLSVFSHSTKQLDYENNFFALGSVQIKTNHVDHSFYLQTMMVWLFQNVYVEIHRCLRKRSIL